MSNRLTITLLMIAGLSSGTTVSADDEPISPQTNIYGERHKTFEQLDLNNDGKLDASELRWYGNDELGIDETGHRKGELILEQIDANNDGFVNRSELQEGFEAGNTDSNWW